jgi:hypothetical protein
VDFRVGNTDSACDTFDEAFNPATARLQDLLDDSIMVSAGFVAPRHHGQGSHPTFTPTPTPTSTNTPGPTNTPTPTSTPGAATNTPAPTSTAGAGATSTPIATWTPSAGGGTYSIEPACNPWGAGGCASTTSLCSRRIFLIPIVDSFGNGSSDPVAIVGFALVFLEGYEGSCSGSSCDIQARFVRADITTGSFAGTYDPDSLVQFVRLTE